MFELNFGIFSVWRVHCVSSGVERRENFSLVNVVVDCE